MVDQHLFSFSHIEQLEAEKWIYFNLIKKAASIETAS
jgi:hypothetical protein